MSMPFTPAIQSLSFENMLHYLHKAIDSFHDKRIGNNVHYSLDNIALSAFSVFYCQDPSFLEHQRRMKKCHNANNAKNIFGITEIPSDNHIRAILDEVPPQAIFTVFDDIFDALKISGKLDELRSFYNRRILGPGILRRWP